MRKIIVICTCYILLSSCSSQQSRQYFNKNDSIEIYFYPSGVKENIRHFITIKEDSLSVIDSKLKAKNISRILSTSEIRKLNDLSENITLNSFKNEEIVEDAWGTKLIINGNVKYESNDFPFGNAKVSEEKLINYIIEISKLELNSFSH